MEKTVYKITGSNDDRHSALSVAKQKGAVFVSLPVLQKGTLFDKRQENSSTPCRKISTPIAIPRRKNSSTSYDKNQNRLSLTTEQFQSYEVDIQPYGRSLSATLVMEEKNNPITSWENNISRKEKDAGTKQTRLNGATNYVDGQSHLVSSKDFSQNNQIVGLGNKMPRITKGNLKIHDTSMKFSKEMLIKQNPIENKSPLLNKDLPRRSSQSSPLVGRKSIGHIVPERESTPVMLRKKISYPVMTQSRKSSGNSSPVIAKKIVDYQSALERRFSGSSTSSLGNQDRKGSTDSNASVPDDINTSEQSVVPIHLNSPQLQKKLFSGSCKTNLASKKKSFVDMFEKIAVEGTLQRRRSAPNKHPQKTATTIETDTEVEKKVFNAVAKEKESTRRNSYESLSHNNLFRSNSKSDLVIVSNKMNKQGNFKGQEKPKVIKKSESIDKHILTIKSRKSVGTLPQEESTKDLQAAQKSQNYAEGKDIEKDFMATTENKGRKRIRELKKGTINRRKSVGCLSQVNLFESSLTNDTKVENSSLNKECHNQNKTLEKIIVKETEKNRRKSVGCLSQISLFESGLVSNSERGKTFHSYKFRKQEESKTETILNEVEKDRRKSVGCLSQIIFFESGLTDDSGIKETTCKTKMEIETGQKSFYRRKSVGSLSQINHQNNILVNAKAENLLLHCDKKLMKSKQPAEIKVRNILESNAEVTIGPKAEVKLNANKITTNDTKPEKKDSGNYEDEHIAAVESSLGGNYVNKGENASEECKDERYVPDEITDHSDKDKFDSDDRKYDIDEEYNADNREYDTYDSGSNYMARGNKVSVIERPPLSICAVSQIPARKKSQVMISVGGIRKQDEESGFFDSQEGNKFNNNLTVLDSNHEETPSEEDYFPEDENPFRSHRFHNNSFGNSNENSNVRFTSLGDLASGEMIGITTRTSSFNSSIGSSYFETHDNVRKSSQDEETLENSVKPRRKMGTVSIVSLDELPKRKMSRVNDWFRTFDEQPSSYESCFIPENISRKMSTFGQYLTFDDLANEGMEVVADKETRDIISVSHDTLSSCSEQVPYRPPSLYRNEISGHRPFDKLRIDEETSEHLQSDEERSVYSSPGYSPAVSDDESDSDESTETLNNDNECKITNSVEKEIKKEEFSMKDEIDFIKNKETDETKTKETQGVIYEKKIHADEQKTTTFSTMFGYFNFCLYSFISKEYGIDKWKEIIGSLNLSRRQVSMFEKPRHSMFDDAITDQVVRTASKMLNINFNLFLQKFGQNYFEFCGTKYGDILKSIATNLADFINNMDDIRRHIHKIEKIADDYPPSIYAILDKQGTLLLYYHSNRDQKYLEYFLIGFIKAAAWILYGMRSRVSLQRQRQNCEDYSIISIKAVSSLVKKPSVSKLQISSRCKDLIIEPYLMDSIFPFHIMFNEKLEMCQLGMSLNRLLEHYIPIHGLSIEKYFSVVKPAIDLNYASIRNNLNTAFILSSNKGMFQETFSSGLVLKGQVSYLESSKCLWFIGSPKVDFVEQLNGDSNLYLSDIPLHDATREVLLVSEQTHEQDALKSQLQVLTNRLKETSKELALGKVNTENILDEIFPKDVAERLMRDLPVPAVTAAEVSILFTDIVGFTAICGNCDPEDVTDMLNDLYIQFDFLCEKFDLYKVETIGDAYMAVGGLHRKDSEHGRLTTAMGIEMIAQAKNVLTPEGESIQIRVGVHSGSVVAGVVGTRMPRYCLFGNNVTLANKMESTSATGKIHISPATYREIKHHQEFIFFERPRDVMPPLMQKLYDGYTYFVTQRRTSTYDIPTPEAEKRLKYMMPRRASQEQFIPTPRRAPSRKTSYSESVMSDHQKYPPELRKQLDALEMLNGYQNGKVFCLPNMEA